MWVSKKSIDGFKEFLESAREDNEYMHKLVKKLQHELDCKNSRIRELQRVMSTKWIKSRCPHCGENIDIHTSGEVM